MGQTCVCANRILVQDKVYDAFAEKLAARVATLKVGNGSEEGVMQGPLINADAVEKVERLLADATSKGAKIATGGNAAWAAISSNPPSSPVPRRRWNSRARRFSAPWPRSSASRPKKRPSRMANDTEFGLAAYFYARDVGRVLRVAAALEYGIVGINEGIISTEVAPFGGMKQSGVGREGSKYGIEEFLEIKYLALGGLGATSA